MDKKKFESIMWGLPPLLYFMREAKIIRKGGAKREWRK
jgi:hypothetical protein